MQNFYSRFLESVEKWPQNVAVEMRRAAAGTPGAPRDTTATAPVECYTYAELRRMSESVGRWLREKGMARGARCAILASNGPRWVAAYLGTIAAGGVAVPFDTAFNAKQVNKLLRDSGSTFLFTDTRHLPVAQGAVEELEIRLALVDGSSAESGRPPVLDAMFAAGPGSFVPAELGPEDAAVILYTSGTTSDPKGVLLTHDNLLGEMDAVFGFLDLYPSDSILGVLPLFHALAQMANLLIPFAVGARVVYLESLNVTELLRALRESQVTLFCCVPQLFYLIHERILKQVNERGRLARVMFRLLMRISLLLRPLGWNLGKVFFKKVHEALGSNMRYLVTGGSRFDAAVGRDLKALGFVILQAYGLTETSGGALCTPPQRNVIGSVGQPLHGVEVKIVDPQPGEDGAPAAGEIAIRGRIVMKGYYNRPEATVEVLREGWLHTGDLGYLDAGHNLFITGRQKEVIVLSSGKNIYPEELEAHYLKSPFIKEICVMGLESRPGEPVSERLHAVVVPNFEVLRERKIVNMKEVLRFDIEDLSAELPSTKRILSYEIRQEELPRTTTRKLKRFEIQKRILEQGPRAETAAEQPPQRELSAEEIAWLEQPEVARAMAVVRGADKRGRSEIYPGDNLELDLGLDSMERVELLVGLERELGAHVDDSIVSEVYTVREMVEAVRSGIGAASTRRGFSGWDAVFATESTDPEVLAITKPRRLATLFWFLMGRVANLLCRDFFQMHVTGLEKLPADGPYILCPNHQSFLDAPVVAAVLPWPVFKEMFHVGTSEIWGTGWRRKLARSFKLIPIDPDANLVPAMRAGAYGLQRGKVLVLYPEGERSIDGRPKAFKKGAAILATHLQAPICPVALDGFYEAWPRGKPFQRFAKLRIAFGDPIPPPPKDANPEAAYERLTAELRLRVVEMWEEIHGADGAAPERGRAAAD